MKTKYTSSGVKYYMSNCNGCTKDCPCKKQRWRNLEWVWPFLLGAGISLVALGAYLILENYNLYQNITQ